MVVGRNGVVALVVAVARRMIGIIGIIGVEA